MENAYMEMFLDCCHVSTAHQLQPALTSDQFIIFKRNTWFVEPGDCAEFVDIFELCKEE
jgi:hypothetical protein